MKGSTLHKYYTNPRRYIKRNAQFLQFKNFASYCLCFLLHDFIFPSSFVIRLRRYIMYIAVGSFILVFCLLLNAQRSFVKVFRSRTVTVLTLEERKISNLFEVPLCCFFINIFSLGQLSFTLMNILSKKSDGPRARYQKRLKVSIILIYTPGKVYANLHVDRFSET